jgi:hypothetical protein
MAANPPNAVAAAQLPNQNPPNEGAPQRAPTWRVGSVEHHIFVALCTRKDWSQLPVQGGDAELDAFHSHGINGVPLTWGQLLSKFRLWKNSLLLAAAESEDAHAR